jgi:hypothetical protein
MMPAPATLTSYLPTPLVMLNTTIRPLADRLFLSRMEGGGCPAPPRPDKTMRYATA